MQKRGFKDEILALRTKGFSYNEIALKLNCSKTTVSYHLNPNRRKRIKVYRKNNPFERKFHQFHRIDAHNSWSHPKTFTVKDVINKFGEHPVCYLTGIYIDIYQTNTYEFDHIIPRSRGGKNSLDNLGIASKKANQSKKDMTPDEYIELCKSILEHHGYQVSK